MQIMDPVRFSSEICSVSAWSTTTLTLCQRGQRLRRRSVGVVNDFQQHPIFELLSRQRFLNLPQCIF